MRLLIVEDQKKLVAYIKKGLEANSFSVDFAYDGEKGENMAIYGEYDLIILDIMLPKKDGIQVCTALRKSNINIPILMLTARDSIDDRIIGLNSGADDYLIKPFAFRELLARIGALLRRPPKKEPEIFTGQDISINSATLLVKKGNKTLNLTLKEFSVLEYLLRNKGKVLNREQLIDHCWDFAYDSFSNIVDVYIKRLRKKLGDKNGKYIQTIRGLGYKFKE